MKNSLKTLVASLAILVAGAGLASPTLASGGSGSGGGSTARQDIRLEARMRSGRTEAKVAWRSDRGRLKVQAEVTRGTPKTKYTVTHKGKAIGTITTDSLGNGRFEFERTSIVMAVGDSVTVGGMKGTMALKR